MPKSNIVLRLNPIKSVRRRRTSSWLDQYPIRRKDHVSRQVKINCCRSKWVPEFWFTTNSGPPFIWSNGAMGGRRKESKIDRSFRNDSWAKSWPQQFCEVYAGTTSNHCAQIIHLAPTSYPKRPFRLYNSWLKSPDHKQVVGEHCLPVCHPRRRLGRHSFQ